MSVIRPIYSERRILKGWLNFSVQTGTGVANKELTPDLAFKLGRAGAFVLSRQGKRPKIAIGKDTRISGDMLEAALTAGILSVGGDCLRMGLFLHPAWLT